MPVRRSVAKPARLVWPLVVIWLAVVPVQGAWAAPVEEASGIVRHGDDLLIVGDDSPGAYFRYPINGHRGPRLLIEPDWTVRVPLSHGELAIDLEGIGILGDGRVVVLSERLRALVGPDGIVAEYGGALSEFGNRGLEGLAVRPLADGHSRVAVLWEGGYPEYHLVPEQLKEAVGRLPLRPVVWIHDLPRGATGLRIRESTRAQHALRMIELEVPHPSGTRRPPEAQRFRAPDLVWHRWKTQAQERIGFIVLLNSLNSPRQGPPTYEYLWLQRFTLDGQPFGEPFDVKAVLPPDLKERNWEGLAWFAEGTSLVLIHDVPTTGAPTAVVIPLPQGW